MSDYTQYFLSKKPQDWSVKGFISDLTVKDKFTHEQITSHFQKAINEVYQIPLLSTTAKKKLDELKKTKNLGKTIELLCNQQQQLRPPSPSQPQQPQQEQQISPSQLQSQQQQQQQQLQQQPQTITNNINSKNVKQIYTNIVKKSESSHKKRKITSDTNPLIQFNEKYGEDIMNIERTSLTLTKDGKIYTIPTPSTKLLSPNKPKIEIASEEFLKEFCIIGNGSFTHDNNDEDCLVAHNEYQSNLQDQKNNTSLNCFPSAIPFLSDVLKQDMDHFVKWIANYDLDSCSSDNQHFQLQQKQFSAIMKYILIDFHCNCQCPPIITNHERTTFVEYIIPSLKALAKVTGLIQFTWCEKQLNSHKFVQLCYGNFKNVNRKLVDGIAKTKGGQEKVIVEVSSGFEQENIKHSLEDTIKLIEAAISTLVSEMSMYKEASIETFKKIEVYTIQVIKDRMTLYSTSIFNKQKWKHIELRSAIIPTKWDDIYLWVKLFELLATLMIKLKIQQDVYTQLQQQLTGLVSVEGETVREFS